MMTAVRSYILSGSTAESDWWGRGRRGVRGGGGVAGVW